MPWQPSRDASVARVHTNPYWDALAPVFDEACYEDPLRRLDDATFAHNYVRTRKGDENRDLTALKSRLPYQLRVEDLAAADVELIDFLLGEGPNRVLVLLGPRGAGKTSLIRFVELVLRRTILDGPSPVLLILDCRTLAAKTSNVGDYLRLIENELRHAAATKSVPLSRALKEAAHRIHKDPTEASLLAAIAELAAASARLSTRVTFVFDNTDQLYPNVAAIATRLSRQLFVASDSRIGSIRCLRPASLLGAIQRSGPRSFFTNFIQIFAPAVDAWLESLANRMAWTTERKLASGAELVAYGKCLTAEIVSESARRLAALLSTGRPREDNALQILQAASADDIRHLIRLTRRLLSHRTLPGEWLIQLGSDNTFHPLTAIVEGPRSHFNGDNPDVPNLLCVDGLGHREVLLPHLALRILNSEHICATSRLLDMLSICGYDRDAVWKVIGLVHGAQLVDFSDMVSLPKSPNDPLPSHIVLTEAGYYYLHYLLRYTDYLAPVVCDVPLEHADILQSKQFDSFAPRLSSIIEYSNEVKAAEEALLRRLQNATPAPELRAIADRLRGGGLLTASLRDGLTAAIDRGRASTSGQLRDRLPAGEQQVMALERWLVVAEQRLIEIANRGRHAPAFPAPPDIRSSEPGLELEVNLGQDGDDRTLAVTVRVTDPVTRMVITAQGGATSLPLHKVAIARREEAADTAGNHSISVHLPRIVGGALTGVRPERFAILDVSRLERTGVLLIDEDPSAITVRFSLLVSDSIHTYVLGDSRDRRALEEVSRQVLGEVAAAVVGGRDPTDALATGSVALRRSAFSEGGDLILAELYPAVDSVIIVSSMLGVPWEWISHTPRGDARSPSIGEQWRTNRWHADRLAGATRYLLAKPAGPILPLVTIGCEFANGRPENLPASFRELTASISGAATLHLVGHQQAGTLRVGELNITPDTFRANPLPGLRSVIVSSCAGGALSSAHNVAATIAEVYGCIAWAPLVELTAETIDSLDRRLRRFTAEDSKRSLDSFMRQTLSTFAALRVYVRYGVCSSTRVQADG